jgi:large subunit ribosomal protein L32
LIFNYLNELIMPHPKRRQSRTRRDKRRTHDKAPLQHFSICPTTGEPHLPHRAFWHDNKLYYKGKIVMERNIKAKAAK